MSEISTDSRFGAPASTDIDPRPAPERRGKYLKRTTAALALVGTVVVGASGCARPVEGIANAKPGPVVKTTPMIPATPPELFPCEHDGTSGLFSRNPQVADLTGISASQVAALLKTSPSDIEQCGTPKLGNNLLSSGYAITDVEYVENSTGDRVVLVASIDEFDASTQQPYAVDALATSMYGSANIQRMQVGNGSSGFVGATNATPMGVGEPGKQEYEGIMGYPDPMDNTLYDLSVFIVNNSSTHDTLDDRMTDETINLALPGLVETAFPTAPKL